jgi:hypothetical protein
MNTASGSVTATSSTGSGTATAVVTDAMVTALQDLGGGPAIQVASTPVDLELGTYTLGLPAAAPLQAPYSASGLVFDADAAAAGKYRIQAAAPGRSTLEQPADVSAGSVTLDFGY